MKYEQEEDKILLEMVCESNEEVRNSLYEKYELMIKQLVKKYALAAKKLGLEKNDLLQEASVGFTDAINHFDSEKDASFKTFAQLCIERRLQNYLTKHQSQKYKMFQDSLSLDYVYDEEGSSLKELLGDVHLDPGEKYMEKETKIDFYKEARKILSKSEYEVFLYMLKGLNYIEIANILDKSSKQIDNTIQRIRFKLKSLLKEESK